MKAAALITSLFLAVLADANAIPNPEIPTPALEKQWFLKHNYLSSLVLKASRTPPLDIYFLGDSITEFWPTVASDLWNNEFSKLHVLNCGVSGDTTQNILYRITHGEFDHISPRVVVLLAGTNNLSLWADLPPEAVCRGIAQILREIHRRSPKTKILLLSIFPSSEPQSQLRERIMKTNKLLPLLTDQQSTFYLDIYGSFLDGSGQFLPGTTFDLTHPTAKGYQIWANAMRPVLAKLLGDAPQQLGITNAMEGATVVVAFYAQARILPSETHVPEGEWEVRAIDLPEADGIKIAPEMPFPSYIRISYVQGIPKLLVRSHGGQEVPSKLLLELQGGRNA